MLLATKMMLLSSMMVFTAALKSTAQADPCTCLGWEDAFSNYGVNCSSLFVRGMGFACPSMLERTSYNVCVNQGIGSGNMARVKRLPQHCLVSSACTKLNGGSRLSNTIAKKFCTPEDPRLQDIPIQSLLTGASKLGWEQGRAIKMAYETPTLDVKWTDSVKYFLLGIIGLSVEEMAALNKLRASGKPTVIDSESTLPPFGLVNGTEAYEVIFDPDAIAKAAASGVDLAKQQVGLTTVTRLDGGDLLGDLLEASVPQMFGPRPKPPPFRIPVAPR